MTRVQLSNFLHRAAHVIDSSMCICAVSAYKKAWRASADAQERRARLIREEGLPVAAADFEDWLRRRAA